VVSIDCDFFHLKPLLPPRSKIEDEDEDDDKNQKARSLRLQAGHVDDAAGAQVILLRGKILLEFFRPSI
jgi:hypothetical protein